jgi:peroxin-16
MADRAADKPLSALSPRRLAPLRAYEQLVRNYEPFITSIEELLRASTLFLPGRFSAGELRAEGIYTALNLLSLYHDRILNRARNTHAEVWTPAASERPSSAGWRSLVAIARDVLVVTRTSQVFLEMAAVRYAPATMNLRIPLPAGGDKQPRLLEVSGRWVAVFAIEAFKALAMMLLLWENRFRPLLTQTPEAARAEEQERRVTARAENELKDAAAAGDERSARTASLRAMYTRHGRVATGPVPAGGQPEPQAVHGSFSHVNADPSVSREERTALQQQPMSAAFIASELLYIVRPLVYTGARLLESRPAPPPPVAVVSATAGTVAAAPSSAEEASGWRGGAHTEQDGWRPLLLSFAIDALSRWLAVRVPMSTTLQREEHQRRMRNLLLYLLRPPAFQLFAKRVVENVTAPFTRLPFLGALIKQLVDLLLQLPSYYFYFSGTNY